MPYRPCSQCGIPVDRGRLCPQHRTAMHNRKPQHPHLNTPGWKRLRRHVLASHVAEYGYVCPGWDTRPHLAPDLTVDHVVPVAAGGSLLDPGNVAVLCRSCNSRKGAR